MTDTDAPSTDAYETYDRSLERLVMVGEPTHEQVRAAFRAGYDAGRTADHPSSTRQVPSK